MLCRVVPRVRLHGHAMRDPIGVPVKRNTPRTRRGVNRGQVDPGADKTSQTSETIGGGEAVSHRLDHGCSWRRGPMPYGEDGPGAFVHPEASSG
jgi:hypothetical protein